jgi:hypothetical protein
VDEIFSAADISVESIRLARCAPDNVENVPYSYYLYLEEIPPHVSLVDYLQAWGGSTLVVDRCLSFDDRVLTELATPRQVHPQGNGHGQNSGTPDNVNFLAPEIRELSIYNCPNISVHALKRLIKVRKVHAAKCSAPSLWDEEPPISHLSIHGKGLRLDEKDVRWFEANTDLFHWHSEFAEDG